MALAAEVADAIGSSTTKDRVAKLAVDRNGLWQAYVVPRFATGRRPYVVVGRGFAAAVERAFATRPR